MGDQILCNSIMVLENLEKLTVSILEHDLVVIVVELPHGIGVVPRQG